MLGSRTDFLDDLGEFGAFKMDAKWIDKACVHNIPSLAAMARKKEEEIQKRTMGEPDDADFRLWTMMYSPAQQAIRLGPGLSAAIVLLRQDLNFELYACPEPAWYVLPSVDHGIIGHLGSASGARELPLSDNENPWSPILFVPIRMGEGKNWFTTLGTRVENLAELAESWADKCKAA